MYAKPLKSVEALQLPSVSGTTESGWQLLYTLARHEKAVAAQLASRGIDYFLPLHHTVHRWNTRSVTLELPLFPCYVFIRLLPANRRLVVTVPGVVTIVKFLGHPASVPDDQIAALRNALQYRRAFPCSHLEGGRRVRILAGPLCGIVGVIERTKGFRVIVSVDCITSSIAIEATAADLEIMA